MVLVPSPFMISKLIDEMFAIILFTLTPKSSSALLKAFFRQKTASSAFIIRPFFIPLDGSLIAHNIFI